MFNLLYTDRFRRFIQIFCRYYDVCGVTIGVILNFDGCFIFNHTIIFTPQYPSDIKITISDAGIYKQVYIYTHLKFCLISLRIRAMKKKSVKPLDIFSCWIYKHAYCVLYMSLLHINENNFFVLLFLFAFFLFESNISASTQTKSSMINSSVQIEWKCFLFGMRIL